MEKDLKRKSQITNKEQLFNLNTYIEKIDKIKKVEEKNRLHRTIFESVKWTRQGDNEPILEVNFL